MDARYAALLSACVLCACSRQCPLPAKPAPKIGYECDDRAWRHALQAGPAPSGTTRIQLPSGAAIFRIGAGRPAEPGEYSKIHNAAPSYFDVPGFQSAGTGACDRGRSGPLPCIVLHIHVCGADLPALGRLFAQKAAEAGVTDLEFNLEVNAVGRSGPRCAPTDPNCRAVPYVGEADDAPLWCEPRQPVGRGPPGGACGHDGDCAKDGCGNECIAWPRSGTIGTCEYVGAYEEAYCGCVSGQCQWFR